MERELWRLLPYILGGMFLLGVLSFLLALHQLRVRRRGAYWLLRRRAGERGGRLFLLSVGLIVSSVALTIVTGLASLAFRNVTGAFNRGSDNLYGIVLPSENALTETYVAAVAALTATPATTIAPTDAPPSWTPLPNASGSPTFPPPEARMSTQMINPPSLLPSATLTVTAMRSAVGGTS